MKKTVKDARLCVTGMGGAVVLSMPDLPGKGAFIHKMEELGRQIADDNNIRFEQGEVGENVELSPRAQELLEQLESIKQELLS